MLRNSTDKFRAKYQDNSSYELKSYRSLAVTPTKHLAISTTKLKTTQQIQPPRTPKARNSHRKIESHPLLHSTPTFNLKTAANSHTAQSTLKKVALRKECSGKKQLSLESGKTPLTQQSEIDWGGTRKTTDLIKDPQSFIESLEKNSIFYCCKCFQYVFEIQKKRHYPDCKDSFDPATASQKQRWQRLERIVELARYTQSHTWEVEELYREVTNNEYSKMYRVSYPEVCSFFELDEVVPAFVYTYEKLLRGRVYRRKGGFFDCF